MRHPQPRDGKLFQEEVLTAGTTLRETQKRASKSHICKNFQIYPKESGRFLPPRPQGKAALPLARTPFPERGAQGRIRATPSSQLLRRRCLPSAARRLHAPSLPPSTEGPAGSDLMWKAENASSYKKSLPRLSSSRTSEILWMPSR